MNLGVAERLHLRVRGLPELNGDYRLNPDDTISIAGIGRVVVGGMSATALEAYLGERLTAASRREVSVSIEVARFRPYFVTGQVSQPGAIEWRPELTLIQAISLSGGVSRPSRSLDDTPERGLMQQQARIQLKFALAQVARLEAEKNGTDAVQATRDLQKLFDGVPDESRAALQAFIARQNEQLEQQRTLIEGRIARVRREHQSAQAEYEAANQQAEEIGGQVGISKELADNLERLKKERLVPNERFLAQRRDLLESRVRYSESRTAVERARARVNALSREMDAIMQERTTVLNDRIESLEREIAQLKATLNEPTDRSGPSLPPGLSYHIARKTKDGVQTIAATLFSEVMPGDVVIVSSEARIGDRQSSLDAATGKGNQASALERAQAIVEASAMPRLPVVTAAPTRN